MNIKKNIQLVLIAVLIQIVSLIGLFGAKQVLAAAPDPGCYKITSGQPQKLSKCPTTNAVYDDGKGGNISGPDPAKCYVYSANLYDGDPTWGEPYVEVSCVTLSACPSGQELRYSNEKLGAPSCVPSTAATSGQFAGGATKPGQVTDSSYRNGGDCRSESGDLSAGNCKIIELLNTAFNLVSGAITLAIIGNIIYAGIQYSTAQGDPSKASKSKDRIRNALIAFLMYISLYAFIQWLIPGGVF